MFAMLHFKRNTSTTLVFVCLFVCYIIHLTFFIATIFLLDNTRLRESSPVVHVHVCYLQDKRVSLLIKVYFSACICYHLFQCRETLPVAPDVNTASAVMMWADMLQSISARERNSRLCVKWSPTGG